MTESTETINIEGKNLPVEVVNGRRQATDENGNVFFLDPAADKARRQTKAELKRQQIYIERRNRLINKGVDPSKVDLMLAEEDYRNLPIEDKFERFAMNVNQSFRMFGQDMQALQHNNTVLADAMDVNFRAMALCLERAGLPKEVQGELIKEAEKQINAERLAKLEAKQKEEELRRKQAVEAAEQGRAESELRKAEGKPDLVDEPGEPAPVPDGATQFGG